MLNTLLPLSILFTFLINSFVIAKVFMKREEALKLAFPAADRIIKKNIFINKEQTLEIESIAKTKLESKLYVFYVGKRGDETLGYAVIDTHRLRTMTETVLIVINPDGTHRMTEILAFFEPPDYMPGKNWIDLFQDKPLNDSLRIGKGIPNITGATITSNSLLNSIRRVLAVFEVAVKRKELK
jgi:Na+-translocating ferredoxin:NAD+ oxidoreductase RnfG subunit